MSTGLVLGGSGYGAVAASADLMALESADAMAEPGRTRIRGGRIGGGLYQTAGSAVGPGLACVCVHMRLSGAHYVATVGPADADGSGVISDEAASGRWWATQMAVACNGAVVAGGVFIPPDPHWAHFLACMGAPSGPYLQALAAALLAKRVPDQCDAGGPVGWGAPLPEGVNPAVHAVVESIVWRVLLCDSVRRAATMRALRTLGHALSPALKAFLRMRYLCFVPAMGNYMPEWEAEWISSASRT